MRIASKTPNSKSEKEEFSFFHWLIGLFRKRETNLQIIPYGGGQPGGPHPRSWPRQAVGPRCFALVALQPRLGVSQQHSLGGAGEPSFQGLFIANLAEHLCLAVVLWTRIGKEIVLILFLHVSAGV